MSTPDLLLPAAAQALPADEGPIVISAKGHSGTRFIAEALQVGGVFMGADMNAAFDSMSWHDDFAVPIMTSDWYPELPTFDPLFAAFCEQRFEVTIQRYLGDTELDGPWGWKGSTLFVTPIIKEAFPATRLLHIIRDGRDVALSQDGQLNLPFRTLVDRKHPVKRARQIIDGFVDRKERDDYRLKIFFGRSNLDSWNDIELSKKTVYENRYLLQMQSWMRNVTEARAFGSDMGDRYFEIRYEDLCQRPEATMQSVLDWLQLPDSSTATGDVMQFVRNKAYTGSIDKWRSLDLPAERMADYRRAAEHGKDLLEELGYEV